MKSIVLLLLALNLLAAFFLVGSSEVDFIDSVSVNDEASIALLSEVEVTTSVFLKAKDDGIVVRKAVFESEVSSKELPILKISFQCKKIGEFKDVNSAIELKQKLISLGVKNQVVGLSKEALHKYWVYIGPYKSERDAVEANAKLRAKKRKGYVFSNEDVKNSISFGVFSSLDNASRLQSALNGYGYRAKVWDQQISMYIMTLDVPLDDTAVEKVVEKAGYVLSSCD